MTKPVLSSFNEIAPLLVQQYQHYLPTAFSEELSLLQKVNMIIKKMNDLGTTTNSLITQWNTVMEWVMNDGLNDEVQSILDGWATDGTLQAMINGELLDQIKADLQIDQFQNALHKYVMDMHTGNSVVIDVWGDSTTYSQESGGTNQVSTPAPLMLQTALRTYFNNNNIMVNNHGVKGNQTTNALRTFDDDIKNSLAQIVYINYGLNDLSGSNPSGASDPAISAEQYRENLKQMIEIIRKYNKVAIVEAQGMETALVGNYTFRMDGAKLFSNTAKQVCDELNVPFVDHATFLKKYLESKPYLPNDFVDGIHPTQDVYIQKGLNMLYPLIRPYDVMSETIIPAGTPTFKGEYQNSSNNTGSKVGNLHFSDTGIKALINIEKSGMDLYGAFVQYGNGASQVEIKVDGKSMGVINTNDVDYVDIYGVDSETLLIQDIPCGVHLIELNNIGGGGRVGIYYLRTLNTRKVDTVFAGDNTLPSYTISKRKNVLRDIDIINDGVTNVQIMTRIPTSRSLYTLDVEVVANLQKGDGFMLFTKPRSDNGNPQGGLNVYLNNNTGYLRIAEGQGISFYNAMDIGSVDLSTTSHRFRVLVTPQGLCTFYIDGSNVGTYNLTKNHFGGFLGFYKNLAGSTRIDSVSMN